MSIVSRERLGLCYNLQVMQRRHRTGRAGGRQQVFSQRCPSDALDAVKAIL